MTYTLENPTARCVVFLEYTRLVQVVIYNTKLGRVGRYVTKDSKALGLRIGKFVFWDKAESLKEEPLALLFI